MQVILPNEQLLRILAELCALPSEAETVEFKTSNVQPEKVGEYLSALANSAAMAGIYNAAWMVWGVDDATHDVVGTTFSPDQARVEKQALVQYLYNHLRPGVDFTFHELEKDGKKVVMLEVSPAAVYPVKFDRIAYIRVGATNRQLDDFPEKERVLRRILEKTDFGEEVAKSGVASEQVKELLDTDMASKLLNSPANGDIFDILEQNNLIARTYGDHWNILNLGAILFACELGAFPGLQHKGVRITRYSGTGRTTAGQEFEYEPAGYALDFTKLVQIIMQWLPREEIIVGARRYDTVLPETAIRELLANALIHQDFNVSGNALRVEIFSDRMEITNAGAPLIETNRFLDQDRSRNEKLTQLMYQLGFCEQRGSGIDRVMQNLEERQVPAPVFERGNYFTRIILFAHSKIKYMTKRDRINACYWHTCLRHKDRTLMTNASLRKRLGTYDASLASRVIRATVEEGLIRPLDAGVGKRIMKYLPAWASDGSS